ncbi:MAG: Wzy polymerase domain-containing protein [Thermoanaerobaculia bacterium]|nr:Wzy polymerase domain-containing protein [Thermoanaerobaculia bacterium]
MLTTFATSVGLAALLATSGGITPPNLAAAIASQQAIVEASPTAASINDLANLMVLAGRFDEAERLYRRALSFDEEVTRTRFNLGLLLQSRGRSDEALELYQTVLATEPEHAWAHYQTGAIHEQRSHSSRAVESYARAFALDPQLYFADVNPQVVANQLLTEAILEAARLRRRSNLAPMQYAQPREITELLLSLPSPETAAPSPAADADASGVESQ